MKNKFYVVKKGHQPGIYNTWDECSNVIRGFPGAIFKSFTDLNSAIQYYNGESVDLKLPEDELYIFTDGSFKSAENKHSFAVLIPQIGYQYAQILYESTNNRNELTAILHSLEYIQSNHETMSTKFNKFKIVSDSDYCILGITQYSKKWFDKDMNIIDNSKKNLDLFRKILQLIHVIPGIEFVKVRSHTNNMDVISYYNDKVDKLAQNI